MIIAGIIMIVVGAVSLIYGIIQNNSLEARLEAFFSSGTTDPGTVWIVVGAIVAVVGVILLIVGLMKRKKTSEPAVGKVCAKCNAKLTRDAAFCPHCGAPTTVAPDPVRPVVCPKCGVRLEKNAKFCFSCGCSLWEREVTPKPTPVPKPHPAPVPTSAKDKGDRKAICPHCGARQSTENTNCKYCGTPMR